MSATKELHVSAWFAFLMPRMAARVINELLDKIYDLDSALSEANEINERLVKLNSLYADDIVRWIAIGAEASARIKSLESENRSLERENSKLHALLEEAEG